MASLRLCPFHVELLALNCLVDMVILSKVHYRGNQSVEHGMGRDGIAVHAIEL